MKDVYKVLENFASDALVDKDEYIKMYNESINDSEGFWKKHAKRINWIKNFSKVKDISFDKSDLYIKWFEDGTLNVSANCIDRHLKSNSDKVALLWQGDNIEEVKKQYKSLAKKWHPDKNLKLKDDASDMFVKITNAYKAIIKSFNSPSIDIN